MRPGPVQRPDLASVLPMGRGASTPVRLVRLVCDSIRIASIHSSRSASSSAHRTYLL